MEALSFDVDAERAGEDVRAPEEYCAGVRACTFGSDFEIRVLSKALGVRVHVYASTGVRQRFPDPEVEESRRWPLVRLSYHTYLCPTAHYQLLIEVPPKDEHPAKKAKTVLPPFQDE